MTQKNIFAALFIIIASFGLLALPYTHWWFNGDDFGGLHYAAKTKHISDVIQGNPNKYFYYVSNTTQKPEYHFSNVYYRPVLCLTMLLQYKLFGLNGYSYLLFNVLVHTINALFLFFLLIYFVRTLPALLGSLFFLFHPQIGFRFGHMANSQYYLNVTFFFMLIFLLKMVWDPAFAKAMAGKPTSKLALAIAYLTFFISVFTRETSLIIPLLIPFGSYLYVDRNQHYTIKRFLSFLKKYFLIFFTFGCISLFYLAMRWHFFPPAFSTASSNNLTSAAHQFLTKAYEWVNFIYDFFWLSWLPYGTKKLKLILIGLISGTLFFFFQNSRQKIVLLFLALSIMCLLWPAVLLHYSPRYFYEISPLVVLLITCCFSFFKGPINNNIKILFLTGMSCFVLLLMYLSFQNLTCREKKMQIISNASYQLIKTHVDGTRPLCFLTFPLDGFGEGIAHAIWILSGHFDMPIFYDDATRLIQRDSNVFHSDWWHLTCSDYFTKNYVKIAPVANGFRFTSTNIKKIVFFIENEPVHTSLGSKTIHKKNDAGVIDFTIQIDSQLRNRKPIFIVWNYKKQLFEIYPQER